MDAAGGSVVRRSRARSMSALGWGWEGQCEHFGAKLMGAMEKKSLSGDAQKLMCARIKIAAQSVMWYYFHAVYARGGGVSFFL